MVEGFSDVKKLMVVSKIVVKMEPSLELVWAVTASVIESVSAGILSVVVEPSIGESVIGVLDSVEVSSTKVVEPDVVDWVCVVASVVEKSNAAEVVVSGKLVVDKVDSVGSIGDVKSSGTTVVEVSAIVVSGGVAVSSDSVEGFVESVVAIVEGLVVDVSWNCVDD